MWGAITLTSHNILLSMRRWILPFLDLLDICSISMRSSLVCHFLIQPYRQSKQAKHTDAERHRHFTHTQTVTTPSPPSTKASTCTQKSLPQPPILHPPSHNQLCQPQTSRGSAPTWQISQSSPLPINRIPSPTECPWLLSISPWLLSPPI